MSPRERHDKIIADLQRKHLLPLEVLSTTKKLRDHVEFRREVYTALREDGATHSTIARKFGVNVGTVRNCINPTYERVKEKDEDRYRRLTAAVIRKHRLDPEVLFSTRQIAAHVAMRREVYLRLFKAGMSANDIAKRFGRPLKVIVYNLRPTLKWRPEKL